MAKKYKTKSALAKAIKESLDNGELIISPDDQRKYNGAETRPSPSSVVVLRESRSGANEVFFDLAKSKTMTRKEFVVEIKAGRYPDYVLKNIDGELYPASRGDSSSDNNLG